MHEPDYTDYTINELRDCLVHIDQEKYPDRYRSLERELQLRQQAGETPTDPFINELTAKDVPASVALRCFWCFSWRFLLAIAISQILVIGLQTINTIFQLIPQPVDSAIFTTVRIIFLALSGMFIMGQALAKRYHGYRIRIVPIVRD